VPDFSPQNTSSLAHLQPHLARPRRAPGPAALFFAATMMTRRLARKNVRTALIVSSLSMFMLGLTFIVAAVYIS
jgi:hypothetical protein